MIRPSAQDGGTESVTVLLGRHRNGDPDAFDRAVGILYDHMHSIARVQRGRWLGTATLDTTALCHEAYLKLAGGGGGDATTRAHFLSVAARAMRQILMDHARARVAAKRGGGATHVPVAKVQEVVGAFPAVDADRAEIFLRLEEGLGRLATDSPLHVRIVECRFFAGLTIGETAEALDVSASTVKRGWVVARAWLHEYLGATDPAASEPTQETA